MRLILFVLCLPLVAFARPAALRILIDPGHGGRDHGTIKDGTNEADITLNVSRDLMALLAKDKRFRPQLTRDQDNSVSLSARAKLAKESRADLFLSIHVNSSPDPRAHGAEFYFQNQLAPDEESMFLAHKENDAESSNDPKQTYEFVDQGHYPVEIAAIVTDLLDSDRILHSSQLAKSLKTVWRGSRKTKSTNVLQAPFYVLSQMPTPSALVELGFLTNPEDFRELTTATAQAKMAEDLYRGLIQYLR